jgi:threonine dehydrogenase-like Zn-dependent dehydrogenase
MIPAVARTTTMPALRKSAAKRGLVLEEASVPERAPGEVLVEVETASICGADLPIDSWADRSPGRIVALADAGRWQRR